MVCSLGCMLVLNTLFELCYLFANVHFSLAANDRERQREIWHLSKLLYQAHRNWKPVNVLSSPQTLTQCHIRHFERLRKAVAAAQRHAIGLLYYFRRTCTIKWRNVKWNTKKHRLRLAHSGTALFRWKSRSIIFLMRLKAENVLSNHERRLAFLALCAYHQNRNYIHSRNKKSFYTRG